MSEAGDRTKAGRGRFVKRTLAGFALAALVTAGGLAGFVASLGPLPLDAARQVSTEITDRNDRLLRAFALPDGRWRLGVRSLGDVDPRYVDLLLAYEDRRFREHSGVDPRALMRAAWQLIREGRVVSGGSTITMQVARLMEPRTERSLAAKLRQMVRAVQLEQVLNKDEILSLYLALAPFGGNIEGVRAASLSYFGKEPKRLSLAESALLVALPQSPESRRPDRRPEAAQAARDRVLKRVASLGFTLPDDIDRAFAEQVPDARRPLPFLAGHLADQLKRELPEKTHIQTSLDGKFQKTLEVLAKDRAPGQNRPVSVAIVAVDHATGEVLARVGASDYFDARRAGQVDMTRALRSPGSTLKPFIYGLAFEDGVAHPETLIDDRPVRFGSYAPENFDMTFQGTVTVRKALQLSLNVPAISLLDRVGAARLSARLRQAGGVLVLPKDETPGLAMGLGGVGVTLENLVRLYAGLARQGTTVQLRDVIDENATPDEPRRLMDQVAAWQVGNVLLGAPPPDNGLYNRIAFKTGTSYGYRDAWAVGFDGQITIGVWVGRPDGAPVPGLVGRAVAAPILFDAFARSGRLHTPLLKAPRGVLVATTAKLPLPLQRFRPAGELTRLSDKTPLRIQFPLDGSRIEVAQPGGEKPPLAVKISGGVGPVTVLVNGRPVGEPQTGHQRFVEAPGLGFMRLTVMDTRGQADTVVVRIE